MHQKHFPENDPVCERVKKAHGAINELSIQLSHLMGRAKINALSRPEDHGH